MNAASAHKLTSSPIAKLRKIALVLTLAALGPSQVLAQTQSTTIIGQVDISAAIGQGPEFIAEQVFGTASTPRYNFEFLDANEHVGLIDLGALVFERCHNPWMGPSAPQLIYRDGVLRHSLADYFRLDRGPRHIWPSMFGIPDPPEQPHHVRAPTRRDPLAPLPFASGLNEIAAELRTPAHERARPFPIECRRVRDQGGSQNLLDMAPALPLLIFKPTDNSSRVAAARYGAMLYDTARLGEPLPSDFMTTASRQHLRVRAHADQAADYQIVTVDMGGDAKPVIGAPRGIGFIGIRHGLVEWKAIQNHEQSELGNALCVAADGRVGAVRPGCSDTGYYQP